MSQRAEPVKVVIEQGKTWTFASALDWPGWSRRGKHPEGAIIELAAYTSRYAAVAGADFTPGPIEVLATVAGNSTTDFGAPNAWGPWDDEVCDAHELERLVGLLERSWTYLDAVVAQSSAALRRGPRGGGRDRDAIVDHVHNAQRAYGAKIGLRIPPPTSPESQRSMIAEELRSPERSGAWPPSYAIRRLAWHVLDHAWEIEDKRQ